MGPNRRAQDRDRAAARAAAKSKRADAERKALAEAQKIVAIWNARQAGGLALWFYPTIGAAIAAGLPWLTLSCPGCGQYCLGRPAHSRPSSGRRDLKLNPVAFVSEVFAKRAVREPRNVDGGTAITARGGAEPRQRARQWNEVPAGELERYVF